MPIKEENLKYLCQWPCTSGPICFTLMLPYSGFTPGQHIKYFLELDNQSPHYDVMGVEASLKQHYVFLSRKPVKRNFYTKSLSKSSIDEHTLRLTKRLYEGNLFVPTDTPRSTLNLNYIVFIHYTLQVKMRTGTFHYDTDISAPVIIGTVPLRQYQEEQSRLQNNINRDCNLCSGTAGGHIVTTQPTLRMREELENSMASPDLEEDDSSQGLEKSLGDEPPSYDSCLPPSFSFAATFGSFKQHALEMIDLKSEENRRINIQLPQFPGYNTFNAHTQADSQSNDSLLEPDHRYQSYGSFNTDHTGRSLDTLDVLSCGGATSLDYDSHNERRCSVANKEQDNSEVAGRVMAAVTERCCQNDNETNADLDYIDNDLEYAETSFNASHNK